MLKRVVMNNYMVYDRAEVELADASMIAVVGDNGSGKSAFLETLPYVLYGTSRDSISNLSRLNGDGNHLVEVALDDWKIVRGRKNGKPILKVYKGNELVSKGSEANVYIIENITGMNETMFLLTSFYGLGANKNADNLIKVVPSVRLETLQKLKGIGIYKSLHKKAKSEHAIILQKIEAVSNKMSSIEEVMLGDTSELLEQIKVLTDGIETDEIELQVQRKIHEQLKVDEDKYRNLLSRIATFKEKIAQAKDNIQRLDTKYNLLIEDKETTIEKGRDIDKALDAVKIKIADVDDAELSKELDKLRWRKGKLDMMLQLKELATKGTVENVCPLCGGALDDGTISKWAEDVKTLSEKLKKTLNAILKTDSKLKSFVTYTKNIETLIRAKEDNTTELKQIDNVFALNKQETKKAKSELESYTNSYAELLDEVGTDYQKLPSMLNEVQNRIENLIARINTDKQKLHNTRETIKQDNSMKHKIEVYKKELNNLKIDDKAYSLLEQAWNRYGIPLNLIRELYKSIQDKASKIYQEFDNGYIRVEEVEDRGKPGVDFILQDRKGSRNFKMLSLGEQAMFFISVRVAIAQIISEIKNIHIETVILDEVLGNLSPAKRDSLIKMLNKVLRKLFPQVIMVSHTAMWDIFSKTIKLTNVNDITKVEVV